MVFLSGLSFRGLKFRGLSFRGLRSEAFEAPAFALHSGNILPKNRFQWNVTLLLVGIVKKLISERKILERVRLFLWCWATSFNLTHVGTLHACRSEQIDEISEIFILDHLRSF